MVGDTSGYYQRMLVVLPQVLFQARELKWGTDEGTFITMFGTRSVSHLRRVFDKYMTISGFQIEETIDRETSGNLEQLLLAVDRFSSICCVDSDLVFIQDECLEAFLELQSFYSDRRDSSCFLQGKEMKKIQATKLLSDLTY